MIIETSYDILLLTISTCITILTLLSAWGLFYVITIIRRAAKSFKTVENIMDNINDTILVTKEKIEHSAAYVSVLVDGVRKIMDLVKDAKSSTTKKKK